MSEIKPQDKPRCQSCGMPVSAEFKNFGSQADGTAKIDYCYLCFKDGDFVNPEQTLEEMIVSSIENMSGEIGMPLAQAEALATSFIPTLKRWQKN